MTTTTTFTSVPVPDTFSFTVCEDHPASHFVYVVHATGCQDLGKARGLKLNFEAVDADEAIALAVQDSIDDGDPDAGAYASRAGAYRTLPCATR